MRGLGLLAAAALAAGLAPRAAWAQQGFAGSDELPAVLVTFESRLEPAQARPGEHVRLIVTADIAKGWYMYSLEPQGEFAPPPTLLSVSQTAGLEPQGPPYEVNPRIKHDRVFDITLAYHLGAARFYQNLRVPETLAPGERTVQSTLRFQVCNERICTPPRRETIQANLNVRKGPVRPAFAYMQRTIDYLGPDGTFRLNADTLDDALAQGLGGFLLLAVAFGLLALLTPCVFPMIPITVTFFASASRERSGNTLGLAVLFGLGIVATYTGLGLLLTFLLGATGTSQFATNPWVNLLVAVFFVGFALSLMGAFELNLPGAWVNRLDGLANRMKGRFGVMVMGLAFTATSFTCTVQFVGTLLLAALVGQIFWPVLGMLVFSTVFALPFFLLALFPRYVMALRGKSGPWMVQLKVIVGILELFIALKFVSNADLAWQWGVFTRETLLGIGAFALGLSALLVLGLVPWPGVKVSRLGAARLGWGVAFLLAAVYFVRGMQGSELDAWSESYLPPAMETAALRTDRGEFLEESAVKSLPWNPTLDAALAQARRMRKPLFIDFTGYTCINCRWMEKKVFAEKGVYDALRERFVLAQLYTDGGVHADENQTLQVERFRTLALPYYVILAPDNTVLAKHAGIMPSAGEFLAWLEQGERQLIAAGSGR